MEITNCDDCSIDITGEVDVALELTKVYFKINQTPSYVSEQTIYSVYKEMKRLIEEEGEENEDGKEKY